MTRTLGVVIARSAAECFDRFCDVVRTREWVPHIIHVKVLRLDPAGRPAEVRFTAEAARGKIAHYTLLYSYDAERRRVAWAPGDGADVAVRGFAAFDERAGGGCMMRYALEPGPGRGGTAVEVVAESREVLESFRSWVEST
jgi:uncharacterized membrane protein